MIGSVRKTVGSVAAEADRERTDVRHDSAMLANVLCRKRDRIVQASVSESKDVEVGPDSRHCVEMCTIVRLVVAVRPRRFDNHRNSLR